jgi:GTP-binding protein
MLADPASRGRRRPNPATAGSRRTGAAPQAPSAARAWLHGARFLVTASRVGELPPPTLPEIAFVGRSNAGKSTAINTLAQHKRLAFASRTPGRTQHINLFELGPRDAPDARLADLPGYGYAAVEREARHRWQAVMAEYLATRSVLTGIVMLVDSRLGFTPLDDRLLDWVAPRVLTGDVRLLVLLTKADKLSRREADAKLAATTAQLGEGVTPSSDIGVALFSALDGRGVDDVADTLLEWVRPAAAAAAPA